MTEQPTKPVRRFEAVNRLLRLHEQPRYLEIGVCEGATFERVEAPTKVAVDPEFRFDHVRAQAETPGASYHEVTSDQYFGTVVGADEMFDVIYLDGLHTFEQTLRDLLNALPHLQPHGTILVDDVRPPSYLASLPDRQNFFTVRSAIGVTDQAWMGDVYKLLWFVDTFLQGLTYRTISNNHGQAVIWRDRRASVTGRSMGEIARLTFEDFVLQADVLRLAPMREIMRELRATRSS